MTALLEIGGLAVRFGGVHALDDVSMSVAAGTIHGLIGPNGAGKTTLLNCIGRVVRPSAGTIALDGTDLLARKAHDLPGLGVSRTFQNLALMDEASALENVLVGLHRRGWMPGLDDFLPTPRRRRAEADDRDAAFSALRRVGLDAVAGVRIGALPYGLRKSVEIARALCARPRLLLLDEPTAGLNGNEMAELALAVRRLRDDLGITVLVITHHIEFLLDVADRITVLDLGRVIADGEPQLVHTDERVRFAYLGADA